MGICIFTTIYVCRKIKNSDQTFYTRLTILYWWLRMKREILKYVAKCLNGNENELLLILYRYIVPSLNQTNNQNGRFKYSKTCCNAMSLNLREVGRNFYH
ncbi:hypothetical protein EPI10_016148 [Gossypium australe]|uniref:Uncharacterized protein n=1 Tax=Gossypium australe TaxID=47621 RepID=A0A5B6VN15_9ROSI|nr:hypothetical protein EPI10_016148 [Gossypium australe]